MTLIDNELAQLDTVGGDLIKGKSLGGSKDNIFGAKGKATPSGSKDNILNIEKYQAFQKSQPNQVSFSKSVGGKLVSVSTLLSPKSSKLQARMSSSSKSYSSSKPSASSFSVVSSSGSSPLKSSSVFPSTSKSISSKVSSSSSFASSSGLSSVNSLSSSLSSSSSSSSSSRSSVSSLISSGSSGGSSGSSSSRVSSRGSSVFTKVRNKPSSLNSRLSSSRPKEHGYHAYVKRKQLKKGKGSYQSRGYKRVTSEPLSKEGATTTAQRAIDRYSNRSGYIKKAGKPAKRRRSFCEYHFRS